MSATTRAPGSGRRARAAGLLALAVLAAGAISLSFALFVPIYSDEIGWKLVQSRLLLDGGVNITQGAHCGPEFADKPPIYLVPYRLLDELAYGDLSWPLKLRIGGILTHLGWLVLVAFGLSRVLDPAIDRRLLFGTLVAALGLGLLPFLLVLNRPEQILLLGAAAFAFAPFISKRESSGSRARDWIRATVLLVAAVGVFAAHPKGVFLLPVVLVGISGAVTGRGARWSALVLVLALGVATAGYWQKRMECPGDPYYGGVLRAGMSVDALRSGDFLPLVRNFLGAGVAPGAGYSDQLVLGGDGWNWLQPTAPLASSEVALNAALHWTFRLLAIGVALVAAAIAARTTRSRRLDLRDSISLALLTTLVALLALQTRRTHYEAGFVVALALLVVALGARPPRHRGLRTAAGSLAAALMVLSLASQVLLWHRFAPRIPVNLSTPGHLEGQDMSISPFGYSRLRPQILAAMRPCGINPDRRQEELVVDDVTYPALGNIALRPLHLLYIQGFWGRGIPDLGLFLADHRSAGVVVRCDAMGSGFERVRRTGEFCCVPSFDFRPRSGK